MLPNRLFFTGVPGSRWSGIAQTLETLKGFDTSDRNPNREYMRNGFTGHTGVYFGKGMEYEPYLNPGYIDSAWAVNGGTKIVKSHDWAYNLQDIKDKFPDDWIMLVYRPDMASYAWWHQAGGFNIDYPNYAAYKNSETMLGKIAEQNANILKFAHTHDLTWNYFTPRWVEENFNQQVNLPKIYDDILVALLK